MYVKVLMLLKNGDEDKISVSVEHEKVKMVICRGRFDVLWNWHE
jgi:hypothetical protein